MKVEIKEPKPWQRVFEIEVPNRQVKTAIEELYKNYGRKAKIPGFRPGKVPRSVLESWYGKGIEAEAIEQLVPESYEKALVEHKIVPVNRAVISDLDLSPEKDLKFKATFEVLPKVEIRQYKGLKAVKRVGKITDKEVDRELEYLRNIYAEFSQVERGAQLTDKLTVDYIPVFGLDEPEKFKGENYVLVLGAAQVLAEFNQHLQGAKAGDVKEITVGYAADYQVKELAGKSVVFKVAVKDVQEKKLPALDDELAKKVSEYPTLRELKDKIRAGMEARAEEEAMEGVRLQALDALIKNSPLELPESLVKEELESMVAEAKKRHHYQHHTKGDKECDECSSEDAKLHEQYRPAAEWKIKEELLLSEIVKQEKIEVSDPELAEAVSEWARYNRQDPDKLREVFAKNPDRKDDFRSRIAIGKARRQLGEWAEKTVDTADLN
ncbi:MAG: trigger factor [Candidatus Edwardsbacteria bacterium]|nr:trigger factor [Candidatus Edwardsbacteria bacterium]